MIPKFRVRNTNSNCWVTEKCLISDSGNLYKQVTFMDNPALVPLPTHSHHVMLSTGRQDVNEKAVMEWDISRSEDGSLDVIVYIVRSGSFCVLPIDLFVHNDHQNDTLFQEVFYNYGFDCFFENSMPEQFVNIVGNVYDNPELLEGV